MEILTNIDENGNDIEFVVGVGVANSIAKQGLLGICVDDVVEDVLFDNKHIPAKEFITDAIPKLLKKTNPHTSIQILPSRTFANK